VPRYKFLHTFLAFVALSLQDAVSTQGTGQYSGCYGLEAQGSILSIFTFRTAHRATAGKRSFLCYGMGTVRRSRREADHSSLSAAYVSE